jgi:hypothetical protein
LTQKYFCFTQLFYEHAYTITLYNYFIAFLNSRNIPACLDQAIQTRQP